MSDRDVETWVKQDTAYGLKPFLPILQQIEKQFGSLDALKGKDVLELGPGRRLGLMRFLQNEVGVGSLQGVGVATLWPWTGDRSFRDKHIVNQRFLDFFKAAPKQTYDLVYSRLVFEQHSIDPVKLIGCGDYWRQFKKKDFRDFDVSYPASIPNLHAVFKQLWKRIKPGGAVVSFIGKRKYSALDREFIEKLRPAQVHCEDLGPLSGIVTLVR